MEGEGTDWRTLALSEVVELRRGFDLPSSARTVGPYPVLSAGLIVGYHDEYQVDRPGLAIGRATNLGRPTWADGPHWPLNTTLYAADFKGNHPKFVFHLFEALDLTGFDSGSVQPMLNRNYIAGLRVRVPPFAVQQAIAELLGALDDKIAANAQVSLGARRLAAWMFARLSETGTRGLKYGDLADISGGGTPSTKEPEYWDGAIPWATPTDITALGAPYLDSTSRTISSAGLAACASRLYEPGSILMTSRATIGAFALARVATAVNQGFIVVQPHDPRITLWLFHEMQTRVDEYIAHANGATFLELSRGRFKDLPLAVPFDKNVMYRFGAQVGPLHERSYQAMLESRKLAELRDTLLPALMSGRVSVREAEATVGAAL